MVPILAIRRARSSCGSGHQWGSLTGGSAESFYSDAMKQLDVDYVVDSSKDLTWHVAARRFAARSALNTANIYIWKDPLDLAYSYWKRGGGLTFWRSEFMKYYPRITPVGLPLLTVNYSALTRQPAETLADVCRALGMPYFPGKEEFWQKDQHQLFGSLGVRRQPKWSLSSLQTTSYPPEFAKHTDALRKQIAEDADLQTAIAALVASDVSKAPDGSGPQMPYSEKWVKPPWFYWQHAKLKVRRYRPQRLDDEVEEAAARPRGADGPGGGT